MTCYRCSTRFSCELIISKTLQSRAPIELDPEFRATKENLQENLQENLKTQLLSPCLGFNLQQAWREFH